MFIQSQSDYFYYMYNMPLRFPSKRSVTAVPSHLYTEDILVLDQKIDMKEKLRILSFI